jgi:hypothetical protein
LGALDPRKDGHGSIYFQIQRQIKAYKKDNDPPKKVKHIPILIIIYIVAHVYGVQHNDDEMAITDMITITFYFLSRPGEFTGTTSDDTPFRLQYVDLCIGVHWLDVMIASHTELNSSTMVSYTFTMKKNWIKGEKIIQGQSGSGLWCPVKATIRWIKYHRLHKSKSNAPISSYYHMSWQVVITAKKSKDVLWNVMTINYHHTGIRASEISTCSLWSVGTMEILCGKIDMKNTRMMGRWQIIAMMHYLHIHTHPIICNYAANMFNYGTYTFQQDKTVPIIDVYNDV